MYLAERVNRKLQNSELHQYVGKKLTTRQLRKILNSEFKSLGVRACIIPDSNMMRAKNRKDIFHIGGEYSPGKKSIPITLNVCVSPTRKSMILGKIKMERLLFKIAQTVQHEKIHKMQDKRHPDIDSSYPVEFLKFSDSRDTVAGSKERLQEMKYLGDHGEVDPYAHDIAMEIKYYYPHMDVREAIKNIGSLKKVQAYQYYRRTFKGTNWDVLRKTLLRKIWKWLPQVIPPQPLAA